MSRRVLINLVAFLGVFAVMLWWAVNNIISFEFVERPYEIHGRFAATAGVTDNSEVAYLGVHYGHVKSVEMEEDPETGTAHVLVTMSIDRDKQIPAGSTAHIFRKSAVGEPYIDFTPPEDFSDDGPMIEKGTVLDLDETTVPLEFSELLRSASRVLAAVDPEQTRTLIHELALAVSGRGQALRSLTINSDALLQTFAERTELLDSLSANSTQLTRTVTERRDSLSSAITDLVSLSETLETIEPNTRVLLDRGTELLGRTADLVADIKANADCLFTDLDGVIDVAASDENLAATQELLAELEPNFSHAYMARDTEPGGVWLRVHILLTETSNPPSAYVPHTELPAVPTVPDCVSTLSSGGVRYGAPVTTTPVPRSGSGLPATGGDARIALALFLVGGASMTLGARRRARA